PWATKAPRLGKSLPNVPPPVLPYQPTLIGPPRMEAEYRHLTADDIEQAVHLESTAFYNETTPERVESVRAGLPPEWTLGAFIDGRIVADVRTIPAARRINGGALLHGCVGPVVSRGGNRPR